MWHWLRRIAIGAVAVAALYIAGGSLAGAVVLGWLLTPGSVDWSGAGSPAPEDPFDLGYRGDPTTALGLAYETVHYPAEAGKGEAWLVPAAAPSGTWAIFVHGIGGIRENGFRQLSILHEAGIPTLMITYRNDAGWPPEERPFHSFGLEEWRDLDAAAGWVLERGAKRIVLVAESMGGAIAGQFLIHSRHAPSVAALVLDAPALDFPGTIEGILAQANMPLPGVLGPAALWLMTLATPARMRDAVCLKEVAGFPGPLFLAHGTGDRLVPVATTKRLLEMRSGETVYLETSADHLRSFKENPERYRGELLGFLRALAPR